MFPSALIYNPLVLSPAQDATAITKLQGIFEEQLGGVNIYHYPSMAPSLDVLLHPRKIDELPVSIGSDLDILKPSSQSIAVGLIYIFPEKTPPQKLKEFPSADIINPQLSLISQSLTPTINSPVGVFTILHLSVNAPYVKFGLQPKQIPLQLPTVERDILTHSLKLLLFGYICISFTNIFVPEIVQSVATSTNSLPLKVKIFPSVDIRNPLLALEKSGDQKIENYCAVGPSLGIISTVYKPSITLLCQSGSTPKNIKHDSLVAFAIRISSLQLVPVGTIQNILLNVFKPVIVQSVAIETLLSPIAVASPLAHRISETNPPDLINLVAVMFPSQVNYYG
ncbi:MAG: hypothetical protein EZS28_006820 [Streblomastix strix]|uniref:Uncharacterized protein n=1 Tax=Streblomastix strix TaxID=222440 RepID=A0A5J4WRW9_9EUKA|nr:MAG: hypothetical protein EZS28_006820 [Streblomastix strix]